MTQMRRGFTIVELIITMIVVAILLGLALIVMGNVQAQARDTEREQDIASLGRGLELRYERGNKFTANNGDNVSIPAGTYPGDGELWEWGWWRANPSENIFIGVPEEALKSPSDMSIGYICALAGFNPDCNKAEKDVNIQNAFRNAEGGWNDIYMLETISINDTYCNNDPNIPNNNCVKYNLYWISETDKTVYKGIPGLKVYRSKHQQ